MANAQPSVVTGPRSPLDRGKSAAIPSPEDKVRSAVALAHKEPRTGPNAKILTIRLDEEHGGEEVHLPTGKDGKVLFVSENRQLRVQLVALPDRMDMSTGASIKGKTVTALFTNNEYRTSDLTVIKYLLQARNYKTTFWAASEMDKEASEKAELDIAATLMADPALAERVMERITANRQEVAGDVFPPMPNGGEEK